MTTFPVQLSIQYCHYHALWKSYFLLHLINSESIGIAVEMYKITSNACILAQDAVMKEAYPVRSSHLKSTYTELFDGKVISISLSMSWFAWYNFQCVYLLLFDPPLSKSDEKKIILLHFLILPLVVLYHFKNQRMRINVLCIFRNQKAWLEKETIKNAILKQKQVIVYG